MSKRVIIPALAVLLLMLPGLLWHKLPAGEAFASNWNFSFSIGNYYGPYGPYSYHYPYGYNFFAPPYRHYYCPGYYGYSYNYFLDPYYGYYSVYSYYDYGYYSYRNYPYSYYYSHSYSSYYPYYCRQYYGMRSRFYETYSRYWPYWQPYWYPLNVVVVVIKDKDQGDCPESKRAYHSFEVRDLRNLAENAIERIKRKKKDLHLKLKEYTQERSLQRSSSVASALSPEPIKERVKQYLSQKREAAENKLARKKELVAAKERNFSRLRATSEEGKPVILIKQSQGLRRPRNGRPSPTLTGRFEKEKEVLISLRSPAGAHRERLSASLLKAKETFKSFASERDSTKRALSSRGLLEKRRNPRQTSIKKLRQVQERKGNGRRMAATLLRGANRSFELQQGRRR